MIIASVFPCICITLTLEGNKRQEYIIKTCDGSGNVNSITITMLPISDITAAASDLTANNVTSDSRAMLQNMQTILAGELQNSSLTESEKQALENAKADLEKALTDHEKTLIGTDSLELLTEVKESKIK